MSTNFMSRPAALLLALTALVLILAPATGPLPRTSRSAGHTRLILGLDDATNALSDPALAERLGIPLVSRSPELSAALVEVSPSDVSRLERIDGVMYTEADRRLAAATAPADPLSTLQTHYFDLLGVPDAWDLHTGDPSVVVAVIDSGVDLSHPDLQGAFWTNGAEVPDNGEDDDANGCTDDVHGCAFFSRGAVDRQCAVPDSPGDVQDDYGHGTFVAGIIGARSGNSEGLSGIAPGVTLMPVRFLDCAGGGSVFDAAQGILYAARNGARVANLSFGMDGDSSVLAAAIREAYYGYGMLVVAAAGSAGAPHVQFPARMPEVIAVASSGNGISSDARSTFSNWGPQVSVAAPGFSIASTVARDRCPDGWHCLPDTPYAIASGSSFAAPMVTALAALLASEQPTLPPYLLRGIIQATAIDLPDEGEMLWDGAGQIQILEAMRFARYYLGY